jgi:hypothetical protein
VAQRRRAGCAAALVALAAAALGCSPESVAARDAGETGDAGRRGCASPTVCDGTVVRACRDGQPAEVVDTCAPDRACSGGRCTSRACQQAETNVTSFVGCLFYALDMENVVADDMATASLLITNPGASVATVQLLQRVGRVWTSLMATAVQGSQALPLALPRTHFDGAGYSPAAALQLVSDAPVTVLQIQSDDTNHGATSSAGTLLLPAHVLGQQHIVITYPQVDTPRIDETAGSRKGAGQVILVGTQDGTHVTFRLSQTASLNVTGGGPPLDPGQSFDLVLDDGDIYQIFSVADQNDLTGSEVTSDQPVALFSGNISTTYGREAVGVNSPDMAHEQLLPSTSWGTSFVAAALPPQANTCDSVLGAPDASIWRVVAAQDRTLVTFQGPPEVTGLPGRVMLDRGNVWEVVSSGGSFLVTANRPVMVMQGIDCEPSLSAAVATDQMLDDLRFAVLPNFDQMIAVVRHAGDPVFLDNAAIGDAQFRSAGGLFEVAHVTLPACPTADEVCSHHLQGNFGVTVRGMDVVCSYAWTAPTWLCMDVNVPGCVP